MASGAYVCDLGEACPGHGFVFHIPAGLREIDDLVCALRGAASPAVHEYLHISL